MTYILLSTIFSLAVVILTFVLVSTRFIGRSKRLHQDDEMSQLAKWRRSSYQHILRVTDGCGDRNLLESGSFYSVYGGKLKNGTKFVVKVFHLQFEGGIKSFDVECKMISHIQHRNLSKLLVIAQMIIIRHWY